MTESPHPNLNGGQLRAARVLVAGLVVALTVIGLALVVVVIGQSRASESQSPTLVDALAQSTDDCVTCHRRTTPGIVEQFSHSTMAGAEVTCRQCHEVAAGTPGSVAHEGTNVLRSPTPARCQPCHTQEVAQFYQSRHSLPAYAAMAGSDVLSGTMKTMYDAIPEATGGPVQTRNALFTIEGPTVTRFACENCHGVGRPQADGSVGQCQKCHLRHEFSLAQARKPETCNACHIGPDHPQWEIYQESPHGIAYATGGQSWNWTAEAGTLTASDMPAATCATCHISGFGGSSTTHDVGDRLTWYLFSPVSGRRPAWQDNLTRMQNVCRECHNDQFIKSLYADGDKLVDTINGWVKQSDAIMAPLKAQKLVTDTPYDEPIDFTYFELWHNWGRTAKFGAWMSGPDYTQWHGAYEILSDLAELQQMANEKLKAAGQ